MVIFDKSNVDKLYTAAYSIWAAENGFCLDKPFLVVDQINSDALIIEQGHLRGYVSKKFFTPFILPNIEDCL